MDVPRAPIRYRLLASDPDYWPVIYGKVLTMWRTQPNYSLEDLSQIKAQTLIIAGEFDTIGREHTARLAKAIRGSQEVIIKGATHTVPTDKPDLINDLILRFLDNEKSSGDAESAQCKMELRRRVRTMNWHASDHAVSRSNYATCIDIANWMARQ
jgi:Serine hydrolase (FSH1)